MANPTPDGTHVSRQQTASAALVSMALAAGCWKLVTVERPALFDMAAYKTIAVEDAPGRDAARMALAIRKVVGETRFDLVSRDMASAMDSVAIIKLTVTENSYFEDTTSEMEERKGDTWLETTRKGTFEFAVTIRAIDGKTGEGIFEEYFAHSASERTSATGRDSPASISRKSLAGKCVKKVAKEFAKLITVERPALFDMAAYKAVAVEVAPGRDATRMALAIRKVVGETRFDLVSRDIASAMDSVAIIKLTVSEDSYFEDIASEMREKKGDTWLETTRKGRFEFAVTIRAIDGKTGEGIFEEYFAHSASDWTSATGRDSPASISRKSLAGKCVKEVAKEFAKLIAPYKERTWVPSGRAAAQRR